VVTTIGERVKSKPPVEIPSKIFIKSLVVLENMNSQKEDAVSEEQERRSHTLRLGKASKEA
jgi:hypothetical protein